MERVAIIAYETSQAVCSSMMMHVEMISDLGYEVVLFIHKDINNNIFDSYPYKKEYFDKPKELRVLFEMYYIDKVWCTNPMYVLKLVRLTKRPIYLWKQGDTAAESFMKHHSYLRKWLLQIIDAYTLRKVKGVIYVSDAMKDFYENKYKLNTKSIVVPCLSEFAEVNVGEIKRIPESFVYIGGLSVWQCFDEILELYSKIRTDRSIFHIITLNTDIAKQKVLQIIGDDRNIEIYGISDRTKIPLVLNQFEFGFLIRKNDIVNHVAAPIKFLEYLSCGVNVIMTNAVPSYAKLVRENNAGTVVDIKNEKITINPYNPFVKKVYDDNFNRDMFVDRYRYLLFS